jgi:hypothetical protein
VLPLDIKISTWYDNNLLDIFYDRNVNIFVLFINSKIIMFGLNNEFLGIKYDDRNIDGCQINIYQQ